MQVRGARQREPKGVPRAKEDRKASSGGHGADISAAMKQAGVVTGTKQTPATTPSFQEGTGSSPKVIPPAADPEESKKVGKCMICEKDVFGGWYGRWDNGGVYGGVCSGKCNTKQQAKPKVYPKD